MTDENKQPEGDTGQGTTPTPATPAPTTPSVPTPTAGFSQADVDRISGNARKEGREKALADLLKELGFENKSALEVLVKGVKEREEAELTEKQKLEKKVADLEAAKLAAEEQVKKIEAERLADKRNSVIRAAVQAKNATSLDDLLFLVQGKMVDKLIAVFDDDKTPDKASETKLAAFVDEVMKAHPTYFEQRRFGSPSNQNGYPPNSRALVEEELRKRVNEKFSHL